MAGYLALADIGLYAVALKVASIFQLIESAFRMAWGPFMWERLEEDNHREVYRRAMKIVTGGSLCLAGGFALLGREALALLTTPAYMGGAPLVGILGFSAALLIVSQTVGLGAGIVKKTEFNTVVYLVSAGANICGLFVLVPRAGLIAVPVCLAISSTITVLLGWYNSERLYFVGFSKKYFATAYIFACTPVAVAAMVEINIMTRCMFAAVILCVFGIILLAGRSPVFRLSVS
jgi:O-antigen/teichoic acid export membrane protein